MDSAKSTPLNVESDNHWESKTMSNYDHDRAHKRKHLLGNPACVKQKWQGEKRAENDMLSVFTD